MKFNYRFRWLDIVVLMMVLVVHESLLLANDSGIELQTRTRVPLSGKPKPSKINFPFEKFDGYDYQILYKSFSWKEAETALVYELSPFAEQKMIVQIQKVTQQLQKQGVTIISLSDNDKKKDSKSTSELISKTLLDKKIKNIILMGITSLKVENKELVLLTSQKKVISLERQKYQWILVRDLLPFSSMETPTLTAIREQEKKVAQWEYNGLLTTTSSEMVGGPCYRFKDDSRKEVVFLVSDDHYDAEKTLPLFGEYLMERYPVFCSVIHGEGTSAFKNIDELERADCLVIFIRRLGLPSKLLTKIKLHIEAGKGIVGLRTASHGFAPNGDYPKNLKVWPEFDKEVLGGNYHNHGANDKGTEVVNIENANDSPLSLHKILLKDVVPSQWHSVGSLYFTSPIVKDATLLQNGSIIGGQTEPLTWVRFYGTQKQTPKSRVAYTGLGHPEDFNQVPFRNLLRNLIFWSIGSKELL